MEDILMIVLAVFLLGALSSAPIHLAQMDGLRLEELNSVQEEGY